MVVANSRGEELVMLVILDCCWCLHARWVSVHSMALGVVANSHSEELVMWVTRSQMSGTSELGSRIWIWSVRLNYMFTNSRYRMHGVSFHKFCMAYNMNGCIPVLYVCCVLCVCVGIEYEYELCWYWIWYLRWCAVTECVIRLGWLMCYLLSITWYFIMLIISIEELTLTTIFQVTSSDWVEASAWSLV
jgi:hypothetical protein